MGFIIAIDGTASAGKSTTARMISERLGFVYLNTGSMYRAATYVLLKHGSVESSDDAVMKILEAAHLEFRVEKRTLVVYYEGKRLEDELRSPEVDRWVSPVAARPPVRKFMVKIQRSIAGKHNITCEGRDIGSTVFPGAGLKVFMLCDLKERAKRRLKEDDGKGISENLRMIEKNLKERDYIDTHREYTPMRQTSDAFVVDTTHLTIEQQVGIVEKEARKRMASKKK
jgi:cytidylate kinase